MLTITVVARVGDALALAGFVVGLCRWRGLASDRRVLAAFLGLSAALGAGQAVMRAHGIPTALMGNLWDLSLLALLIPALLEVTRHGMRKALRPFVLLGIVAWTAIFLLDGQLPAYNDIVSLAFYALLAISAFAVLYQFVEDGGSLWKKDAFVVALACLAGSLFDIQASVAFLHPKTAGEVLRWVMVVRNSAWCFAYALLGYSLFLRRRAPRVLPEPPKEETSRYFFYLKEVEP